MDTAHTCHVLRDTLLGARAAGRRIGFVPTMGNLHPGHLALVRACLESTDLSVVSIFVNPSQFAEGEDLDNYPRTLEEDVSKLSELGVDLLFLPEASELYPLGPERSARVEVPELGEPLCGQFRPGFFRGVATVVNILLNVVQPDVALFGCKDYQQLLVIERMVRDLRLPVEIAGVPTVRESDGLAMSSRNVYLSDDERRRAPRLYEVLCELRDQMRSGNRDYREMECRGVRILEADGFRPDYLAVRKAANLAMPARGDSELVVLGAVWLGKARLIDNVVVRAG